MTGGGPGARRRGGTWGGTDGMDRDDLGLLIAAGILALVAWGAVGRGSLARAVRDLVWPAEDGRDD